MVDQASPVTTVPTVPTETEEDNVIHSLAIVDDDYEAFTFYADYDMSMSDI